MPGGNQYIEFARVVYCKLPTNGKQLPAFPLKTVTGIEPRPQRWEARVLPLCHRGPLQCCKVSLFECYDEYNNVFSPVIYIHTNGLEHIWYRYVVGYYKPAQKTEDPPQEDPSTSPAHSYPPISLIQDNHTPHSVNSTCTLQNLKDLQTTQATQKTSPIYTMPNPDLMPNRMTPSLQ